MLQNTSAVEYKHQKFVERVIESQTVWALKSKEGYATADSNEFEDVEVIPFWSDKAYANVLAKDEWESFEPSSIPLSEFLEDWLVGMNNDGMMIGTNWDQNLFGKEIEPLDLALEISTILVNEGTKIDLEKFKDINEYHNQVRKALGIN
jgi:hypothetical protein